MDKKAEIQRYYELIKTNKKTTAFKWIDDVSDIANIELNDIQTAISLSIPNCFFEQMDVDVLDNKVLIQMIMVEKLDFYGDWNIKKFTSELNYLCNEIDDVYICECEYGDIGNCFSVALLFDITEYRLLIDAVNDCKKLINKIVETTAKKLKGNNWLIEYEEDELLFCKLFLSRYFRKMKFENVIFNHGNNEFGKDYILSSNNIFGYTDYYGVQVKAGNLSGKATNDVIEIANQIKMAFRMPYKFASGTEVFMSKIVVAISGNFTNNAIEIIKNTLDKYMDTNTLFLSKKDLENSPIMDN